MSGSCEFCGGELCEAALARNHVWSGCRRCLRSWREDLKCDIGEDGFALIQHLGHLILPLHTAHTDDHPECTGQSDQR